MKGLYSGNVGIMEDNMEIATKGWDLLCGALRLLMREKPQTLTVQSWGSGCKLRDPTCLRRKFSKAKILK